MEIDLFELLTFTRGSEQEGILKNAVVNKIKTVNTKSHIFLTKADYIDVVERT